jgi:thiosulfate/3-mercaptopyruvate sulfurtransferase
MRPEILATADEVRACARGERRRDRILVDVRKTGEWDGTHTRCYPFFAHAGHIPTAIHQGDWDTLMEPSTQKIGPVLPAIARRWRAQGIINASVLNGDTTLIFYCGTGWRSSVAFLVATLLGVRVKNYDDGFYGWSWEEEPVGVAQGAG